MKLSVGTTVRVAPEMFDVKGEELPSDHDFVVVPLTKLDVQSDEQFAAWKQAVEETDTPIGEPGSETILHIVPDSAIVEV